MLPFDTYPGNGRVLLGLAKGSNSRHEYGPQFMQISGQRKCAYCETDLTETYENWLTIVLDHAIPSSVCKTANIRNEWCEDFSNTVLACTTCNSFCNRYTCVGATQPSSLNDFYDLRDKIFAERKQLLQAKHEEERKFFETQPWEPVKV